MTSVNPSTRSVGPRRHPSAFSASGPSKARGPAPGVFPPRLPSVLEIHGFQAILQGPEPRPNPQVDYLVFGRYGRKGDRFEPSGISRIQGELYLVVNDKDDSERFSIHERTADGSLVERSAFDLIEDGETVVEKLEDVAASHTEPGVLYAIGSFTHEPGDPQRRFVRLQFDDSGLLESYETIPLADPREIATDITGESYAKVEGVALSPAGERYIVGVRTFGPSRSNADYQVLILEYDVRNPSAKPKVKVNLDLEPVLGRPEGISAIEYVPELGGYLMLTSYEVGDSLIDEEEDPQVPDTGYDANGVGGHVWFVKDLAKLNDPKTWRTLPRAELDHKPEGVSFTSDGKILVVYDDDADRKDPKGGKGKFTLEQHEAAYSVIHPSVLRTSL